MIKMYTTPFCKYCKVAKEYFKSKNLMFQEIDVTKDDAALNEMVKKSQQMSVPVFDINGEILVGFNRAKLEKIVS